MTTRLELATNKLEQLRNELNELVNAGVEHQRLTNGQPMNDIRNGLMRLKIYKTLKVLRY